MIDKIRNFIIGKFTAGRSNENVMRLKLGTIQEMLLPRTSFFISRNRTVTLDTQTSFGWVRKKGNFFLYPKKESNPHIVISGMSGFGKSTLFKSMLLDISNSNIPCIIFDAHNEHSEVVRSLNGTIHNVLYSGINILELDGASVSERISELSRLFKEVYALGHNQTTKLSECIWYTYRKAGARDRSERNLAKAPTIKDLVQELNIFVNNSRTAGERNTLLHLRDRFSLLNSSAFANSTVSISDLQKGIHSFSLSKMKSKEAQFIYIGELLSRIYSTMHDGEQQHGALRLYVMIDEAQFLTDNSNSNSIISKLIEEGRKYGIGVIIITHAASSLNKKVIANASAFITFFAREPSEVSFVSKVLANSNNAMVEAVRNRLQRLEQNQIMMVSNTMRNPVVISTPRFDDIKINKKDVDASSDDRAIDILKAKATHPRKLSELMNEEPKINTGIISKSIQSRQIDYLNDHYDDSEWIMLHSASLSIDHEVWVMRIAEVLEKTQIQHFIIDNCRGPDISVIINGKRIAIEYETGYKWLESSIKMLKSRLPEYSEIIVITKPKLVDLYRVNLDATKFSVIGINELETLPSLVGMA